MLPLPILRMLGTPPPCPLHWSWRDLAELPPADENHRRGEDEYLQQWQRSAFAQVRSLFAGWTKTA